MSEAFARETVDQLIDHFWQSGYLTLSRKYGTYLPSPNPIGKYNVDAVGRCNKKLAIGIVISGEDLESDRIISKLVYLATRQSKVSSRKVTLFVGVYKENVLKVKDIINKIDDDVRKNIRIVTLEEKTTPVDNFKQRRNYYNLNKYVA
jgi:hypothetical protein